MNYKNTPEYKGQKRELKPEFKKLLARLVIGGAIVGTAFGASQTEAAKKIFNVANEVKSGEVSPDLITIENGGSSEVHFDLDNFVQDSDNPDVMRYDNGAKAQEIVNHTLGANEKLVIKAGANFRDEPVVGDLDNNDIVTTFAKANEDITLSDIHNYSVISNPENAYKDQFMGINVSSLPQELQDEMGLGPNVQKIWIKLDVEHSEVVIETKTETTNTETVASVPVQ